MILMLHAHCTYHICGLMRLTNNTPQFNSHTGCRAAQIITDEITGDNDDGGEGGGEEVEGYR